MKAAAAVALLAFTASMGLDWPTLPGNARLADLLFLPLLALTFADARRGILRLHMLDGLVAAYLIGVAPSFLATDDLRASAIELARRVYLAVVYIVIAINVRQGRGRLVGEGLFWGAFALAAIGAGFFAASLVYPVDVPRIGEVMRLPYVGSVLRVRALTAAPAMLGCLFIAAIPFALAGNTWGRFGGRRMWAAMLIGCVMLLTFSHTVAGFALAALIAGWPSLRAHPKGRLAAAVSVALLLVALNVTALASVRAVRANGDPVIDRAAYPYAVDEGHFTAGPVTVDYAVMSYLRVKQVAWDAFISHPWTGIGLDRFHRVTEAAFQQHRLPVGYRIIDPHSSLLGQLAETGVFGGVTLLALWVGFLRAGWRLRMSARPQAWLGGAAVAGFAGLIVSGLNVDIMNFRFLWAGLGLLRGLVEEGRT